MSKADSDARPDVLDLCETWLKLDYPDIEPAGTCANCSPQTSTDAPPSSVKSSYRPPAPFMQGA